MNAPKTRREHEVWQACDDLWAFNASLDNLKGDQIRDQLLKLGFKKGSPNEIYKYRATWKESRGVSEKALVEAGQQTDPIGRAVSLVYEQLQQEAAQKIASIQSDTHAQLENIKAQNQELILNCETTLQKHKTLLEEHEVLKLAHETLRETLSQEKTQTRELQLQLDGYNLLLSELKNTYAIQLDQLEKKFKEQGYALSEQVNAAKLEARSERDKYVKLEADTRRLLREQERLRAKIAHKEFQQLTKLIKNLPKLIKKTDRTQKSRSSTKKKVERTINTTPQIFSLPPA